MGELVSHVVVLDAGPLGLVTFVPAATSMLSPCTLSSVRAGDVRSARVMSPLILLLDLMPSVLILRAIQEPSSSNRQLTSIRRPTSRSANGSAPSFWGVNSVSSVT